MGWGFWAQAAPTVVASLSVVWVAQLWRQPARFRAHFLRQGVRGPPPRPVIGNMKEAGELMAAASSELLASNCHDILPGILPFVHQWSKIYGSTFLVWFGTSARLIVSDPSLTREIYATVYGAYEKYESHPLMKKLEGKGLMSLKGQPWAQRRRVISPVFYMENLKLMMPIVAKGVAGMLKKWSLTCNSGKAEIEVSECFYNLTEEIVTRAIFGGSYEDGKVIYQLQNREMAVAADLFDRVFIPGYKYLPTNRNITVWKLDRQIRKLLATLIERRRKSLQGEGPIVNDSGPRDLLGHLIMESLKEEGVIREQDIVEECKSFFFAGKNTSSTMMIWTTLLLAMHPHWQHLAREEILRVCGARDSPTMDQISSLKILGMVIHESLRLYPPAVATTRRTNTNVELGSFNIPSKTEILIPILAIHHDPNIWGPDVHEFDPSRFAQGVARSSSQPIAYMPFGLGARQCIGQNLATLQAKLATAMISQRFSFEVSPNYKHAPAVLMLVHPQFGAPIVFQRLYIVT